MLMAGNRRITRSLRSAFSVTRRMKLSLNVSVREILGGRVIRLLITYLLELLKALKVFTVASASRITLYSIKSLYPPLILRFIEK